MRTTATRPGGQGVPLRTRVVLVVEDDQPIGDLLADAINDQAGYSAVRVGNAADALKTLGTVTADLIVLDLHLPGMSGVELYDRLRADERYRDLPVIFETARVQEHTHALRARGIATYVAKPFDLTELVRYVMRLAPPFPAVGAAGHASAP